MGASSENFCLRWNDFESNVSGSFRELREESDFFDVSLATSDSGSRTLQAHKVILSACSNFFKTVLRQQSKIHTHPHPLIYLRGVTYNDLLSVLDFMYHGEVNVAKDDLNSFLEVAEELQVKGLTNKEQSDSSSGSKSRPSGRVKDGGGGPPPKRTRRTSPSRSQGPSNIDEDIKDVDIKEDPEASNASGGDADDPVAVNPDEEGYDDPYGEYYADDGSGGMEGEVSEDQGAGGSADGTKDLKLELEEHMIRIDGIWSCTTCMQNFRDKTDLRRHVEAKHIVSREYFCRLCNYKTRTSYSLRKHELQKHFRGQLPPS